MEKSELLLNSICLARQCGGDLSRGLKWNCASAPIKDGDSTQTPAHMGFSQLQISRRQPLSLFYYIKFSVIAPGEYLRSTRCRTSCSPSFAASATRSILAANVNSFASAPAAGHKARGITSLKSRSGTQAFKKHAQKFFVHVLVLLTLFRTGHHPMTSRALK